MTLFKHTLIGIGSICDADCKVVFTKQYVVVCKPQQQPLITGWREPNCANIWRIALIPLPPNISTPSTGTTRAPLQEFSAYDLPRVEALVRYFHAWAIFPLRDTWLRAIKFGNYSSLPGLAYANAAKYCSSSENHHGGYLPIYTGSAVYKT